MPDGADVAIVEVDRGGKSTYHAPGQLVCYPILDLTRHGQDVRRYCRQLEEALAKTLAAFSLEGTTFDGLTGVWLDRPPRKIASIGIHIHKWVTTHGYALNVGLDPAPFTQWITACGLDGYAFTTMAKELGRPVTVDEVRPAAAQALADVLGVSLRRAHARNRLIRVPEAIAVRREGDALWMETDCGMLAWGGLIAQPRSAPRSQSASCSAT